MNYNANDFLNNLENYISELKPVHFNFIADFPCIILHGNEDLYLQTYALRMIKDYFKIEKLSITTHENYKSSMYHFEFDYNQTNLDSIKSIIRNKNITNNKYIFVIKKFTVGHKQHQLRHLIDTHPNSTFIILNKTLGGIDQSIFSRASLLKISFTEERIKTFLKDHYDLEYKKTDINKSLISIIAEINRPKYEIELEKLMQTVTKGRNQMDIVTAIKEYCYKVFHLCIPLSHLCKAIIKMYEKNAKILEIIKTCSECDHKMVIGTRDILSYEKLFVNLWMVFKSA